MGNVLPLRHPDGARTRTSDPEPLWRWALGRQLRRERCGRGERICDVAERAGVAPQYLSELERGRKDPSSEVLAAVAGALGLTVGELAGRASDELAPPVADTAGPRGPVLLAA